MSLEHLTRQRLAHPYPALANSLRHAARLANGEVVRFRRLLPAPISVRFGISQLAGGSWCVVVDWNGQRFTAFVASGPEGGQAEAVRRCLRKWAGHSRRWGSGVRFWLTFSEEPLLVEVTSKIMIHSALRRVNHKNRVKRFYRYVSLEKVLPHNYQPADAMLSGSPITVDDVF